MTWAGILKAVASALARESLPAGPGVPAQSLLAALTQPLPQIMCRAAQGRALDRADGAGPLIRQYDLPPFLLAHGLFGTATAAVKACGSGSAGGGCADDRVIAAVAVCALSADGSVGDRSDPEVRLPPDRLASDWAGAFDTAAWSQGLAGLAQRTAELNDLLLAAGGARRLQWHGVTLEDRILAEAVAAAVVGGAASDSAVPPMLWRFPFGLFGKLGLSAAEDSVNAIEGWLGVEFRPAPHTVDRTADLAVLVATLAKDLSEGCRCKDGIDPGEVAFVPRGDCRQEDHDLRLWQPGQTRPGSRGGGRFAATLWGWQRRWLGGAVPHHHSDAGHRDRPRLRPNDVAGSVLARRWLATDRGFGGPVLRYDRILPEVCLACGERVRLAHTATAGGRAIIERVCPCGESRYIYRAEVTHAGGGDQLRHKLGLVVASQEEGSPGVGYCSTAPLGPLWVCGRSGRYSLAQRYCPDPGCGPHDGQEHTQLGHAWALLPRGHAWADLRATATRQEGAAIANGGPRLSETDMQLLRQAFDELNPGSGRGCRTETDLWHQARQWSAEEVERFPALAGRHGLELLLRCKQIAEGEP